MKNRRFTDLYLPKPIAYHVKIVVGSLLITMFFSFIWTGKMINESFWFMFFSVIVQLEIFMWIALRIFSPSRLKKDQSYKKQMITRLIGFYILVIAIAILFAFTLLLVSIFVGGQNFGDAVGIFMKYEFKNLIISWLIGATIGSLVFFYQEWNNALKREQKLREEKLVFQYETLKSQVNPHFLFNSLNTLSSIVSTDPKLSEEYISKFSSIYRYILENAGVDYVALSKEIDFVNEYFFLQKIRDNGKIQLQIKLNSPEKYEVLPISLQLLVENALKHNAATMDKPLQVAIEEDGESLVVRNNLSPKTLLQPSSRIGLKNLRERVKLVMNKELIVDQSSSEFIVKLPIKQI